MANTSIDQRDGKGKSLLIAAGMAVVLFLYGYILSTAGHDHSSHSIQNHMEEEPGHDHDGHAH